MQYMAGLGRAQGIRWRLNYIHSMKYAEVINASIAANSAGIDYRCPVLSIQDSSHTLGHLTDRYLLV